MTEIYNTVCALMCLYQCVRFLSYSDIRCTGVCVCVSAHYHLQLPLTICFVHNSPLPYQENVSTLILATNYCSAFILLRAEPALNHSICVSLKVWLSEMDCWLPSACLITAVSG